MRVPTIMVSSTFYDLRQIRADLAHFIGDELGFTPLLSELHSFPVDPDLDTIENCKARVEKNADILILVIGGRYGSIDHETEKSITNLEFLTAKNKGIPIYAFVEKGIMPLLDVWKKNPQADFSNIVDTPKLFDFIETVRNQERVWTFPFESAKDITDVLRIQLAYLIHDALQLRLKFSGAQLPSYFDILKAKALRIALEKPTGWEYLLFFQTFIDEVEERYSLIKEYRTGIAFGTAELVLAENAFNWINTRMHELERMVNSANKLLNESAQDAFGKPGEPGNVEEIVWVSHMFGRIFENMLRWAHLLRCSRIEEPFTRLAVEMSLFVEDLISQFQSYPKDSLKKVEDKILKPDKEPLELKMIFKLSLNEAFFKELEEIENYYKSR